MSLSQERKREGTENYLVHEGQEQLYFLAGNFCQKISEFLKAEDNKKYNIKGNFIFFVLYSKSKLIAGASDSSAWFPGC